MGAPSCIVALVEQHLTPFLGQKGVIDIEIQVLHEELHDSDPEDQGHEGIPYVLRGTSSKYIDTHDAWGQRRQSTYLISHSGCISMCL